MTKYVTLEVVAPSIIGLIIMAHLSTTCTEFAKSQWNGFKVSLLLKILSLQRTLEMSLLFTATLGKVEQGPQSVQFCYTWVFVAQSMTVYAFMVISASFAAKE